MIVADTDVLVDALRGKRAAAGRIARALEARELATTAISVFELWCGARTEDERVKVRTLLAAVTVLPLDDAAGEAAAVARRALESEGWGIGLADYLIAGVCIAREATLLTRNREHFDRVPGLLVADLD